MEVKGKNIFWFIFWMMCIVIEADVLRFKNGSEITNNDGRMISRVCISKTTLMISGPVLKLSDVLLKEDRACNDSVEPSPKIVELFATEKVIIDRDLDQVGEELNMVVISPRWVVEGERRIVLDGAPQVAQESEKGTIKGNYNGAHGKSGLPGGRAGRFYGVGKSFINAEKLTISANGGNRGPTHVHKNCTENCQNGSEEAKQGDGKTGAKNANDVKIEGISDGKVEEADGGKVKDADDGKVKETDDGKVKDAGDGKVKKTDDDKVKDAGDGKVKKTDDDKVEETDIEDKGVEKVMIIDLENPKGNGIKILSSSDSANNGQYKLNGDKNFVFKEKPIKNSNIIRYSQKEPKFFEIINDFKVYAQWYLLNQFSNDTNFQNFYNLLENQSIVKNSFTTLAFVNEYYYLESLLCGKKKFYQSLHQRLKDYQKNRKLVEKTAEYDEILENLEEDLSVKISGEELNESIDLNTDLEDLKERIKERNEIRERVHQREEILSVKASLEYKSAEIRNLSREIQEKFDNFVANVEERIERLISEARISKDDTRYKQLEKKFEERFSLQSLYFLKLGIEFAIPMSLMIFTSNLYHSSMASARNEKNNFALLIPAEIQDPYQEVRKRYETYINKRVDIIKNHTSLIKEKTKMVQNPEDAEALSRLSFLLENLSKNLTSSYWIKKEPFKWEIEILLEEEGKLNLLSGNDTRYEIPLQVIQNLKLDSKCAQVLGESYERFATKLNEIGKAISDSEENFKYLEDLRKTLFEEILPSVSEFRIKLGMTEDSIKLIPKIRRTQLMVLDYFLDQVNMEVSFITYRDWHNGSYDFFARDLRQSTDDLRQMLSQLFYLNRIVKDKFHLTSDAYLSYKWALLELSKENNGIFSLFSKTMTKFIQYSFPYVKKNLEPLVKDWDGVSRNLMMINNSDSLVEQIDKLVDHMKQSVEEKSLENFILTEFSPSGKYPSFYDWRNEDFKQEIGNFLSGEEIILESRVWKEISAVKFATIGLRLKHRDANFQKDLDLLLTNFSVILTHRGNSYYRCQENVYLLTSESSTFVSQFQTLNDNSTILLYHFLFSPFATWSLKFKSDDQDLSQFEKYKNSVDLQLIGTGAYLKDNHDCETQAELFYRKENATSEPELVRKFQF